MATVADAARPVGGPIPTQAQYVNILESQLDPHLPNNADMDDTLWGTLYAAQDFTGLTDHNAHQTGPDAIPFGASQINPAFIGWTVVGNVIDGGGEVIIFQGTTSGEASITQGLTADPTAGQEVIITGICDHIGGGAVDIGIVDDNDNFLLMGQVIGRADASAATIYQSIVVPADMTNAKVRILDSVGDANVNFASINVYIRDQVA